MERDGSAELEVLTVLRRGQTIGYIGEPVTQLEHALQTFEWASVETEDAEVLAAALTHDIGHLLTDSEVSDIGEWGGMQSLGRLRHEDVGSAYLRRKGFSERVCLLVASHVPAKRYLVRDPEYAKALSAASRETLEQQGGPMTDEEATRWEASFAVSDDLRWALRLRRWDDMAKDAGRKTVPAERHHAALRGALARAGNSATSGPEVPAAFKMP